MQSILCRCVLVCTDCVCKWCSVHSFVHESMSLSVCAQVCVQILTGVSACTRCCTQALCVHKFCVCKHIFVCARVHITTELCWME